MFVGRVAGSVVVEVQIIKLSKLWPELGGGGYMCRIVEESCCETCAERL